MNILNIPEDSSLLHKAYELYISAIQNHDLLHQSLSYKEFQQKLFPFRKSLNTIHLIDSESKAFASGCLDQETGKAYITLILVDPQYRQQGLGRTMLHHLENRLLAGGKKNTVEISFFNPITFTWRIPDVQNALHPNTPGIDILSPAYSFFEHCGYNEFATQQSYYLPLGQYQLPPDIPAKKAALLQNNISIQVYNHRFHQGMDEMITKLGNPVWNRELLTELPPDQGGRPILTAVHEARVCGFAGPLDVEASGRGYFSGIGIDSAYRGRGLAKVLFNELCANLKDMGADYMTLFTGIDNPAGNIYREAGFFIVRTWANMKKTER